MCNLYNLLATQAMIDVRVERPLPDCSLTVAPLKWLPVLSGEREGGDLLRLDG